ncbi:MAG: SpoIIE family protein phosphatase [Mycobacteriales bacterium]
MGHIASVPDRVPVELPLLRPLFDALGVGVWSTDRDGIVTACSPETERILGYPESVLIGRVLHDLVHRDEHGEPIPASQCPILAVLHQARAAEGSATTFRRSDGSLLSVNWGAAPMVLGGEVTGSLVAFFDTSRERADREGFERELAAAHDANERMKLIADTGTLLAGGLDVNEAMRRLANLVVPALGDASVVDFFTPPAQFSRVALAHRDPRLAAAVPTELVLPAPQPHSRSPLAQLLAGVEVVEIKETKDELAGDFYDDDLGAEEHRLFEALSARSVVVAALRVGTRLLGALTVARGEPNAFTAQEVGLVQDVARRAALAVDGARAYALHRRAAETLQRSLLSEPPTVRGLSIAARYLPAVAETRLGGDWYDAFCLPDDSLAVVIGDVAGHDIPAAAVMAQVRNLLRAHAIDGGDPASVLRRLEATMDTLGVSDLVTLVYGRLSAEPPGWRFTWSNAGHLPPLLVSPDGRAEYLSLATDLPVGVSAVERSSESLLLEPGSTLLLFTDGLIERREESIDDSLSSLASACERTDPSPPLLLTGLLTEFARAPADDVAVLALRVDQQQLS